MIDSVEELDCRIHHGGHGEHGENCGMEKGKGMLRGPKDLAIGAWLSRFSIPHSQLQPVFSVASVNSVVKSPYSARE
jgi:hypothetical protein